ncbi:MAG: hypothetical protein J0H49_31140 [Acidobacteria bacterium]|nr:hypothetical protein [Acidobacteriota bacterium]
MNAFLVEQTKEDFTATAVFQNNAELAAIRLKRFAATSPDTPPVVESGFELILQHRQLEAGFHSDEASFAIEIRLEAIGDKQPDKQLFSISCCYELTYDLRPGYTPSPLEISAFHSGNALFHCWPFVREFAQNATQRMGIPVPPIPMFRVQMKEAAAIKQESEAAKKTASKRRSPKLSPPDNP